MNDLLKRIKELKNSYVNEIVSNKISSFKALKNADIDVLFQELSFCLLTANFNAEKSLKIQNALQDKFITLSESALAQRLKELGHRHPNVRAKYIVEARKHIPYLKDILHKYKDEKLRDWFVKNVKGLGLKEASHFLRNIGFTNFAIIDFHIIDLLVRYNLIDKPKTITPKIYFYIENVLNDVAKKSNLTLAELDLYLWYLETGKIIK